MRPRANNRRFSGRRNPPDARRGLAAVETAIVLPVVLLLTLATIDFGRIVYAYLAVSNAANAGAEYGAMHQFTSYTQSYWQSQIQSAIQNEMQNLNGFSPANLQTSYSTTTDSAGLYQLTVSVSYPFSTIVNWPGIPNQVQLSHQVVMRQLR
jgi:Flp pilus assembly protein TadG